MAALDPQAAVPRSHHLRAAGELIADATRGLSIDVMRRTTGAGWSIAEILEHLTLAFTANTAALEKALASGPRARAPLLKQTLGRWLVVDLGYFPKAKAPASTVPSGSIQVEECVPSIERALIALDGVLTQVADRCGSNVRVANHPYFGGMTVEQWRKFHWRHTVHHMRQVRKMG